MVRGLVPSMSDMSVEPFWYDCRIGSYMIRYKGYCHSLNGGAWSVTKNTQSRNEGHSNMIVRCVLTWSEMWAHGHYDVIEGCVPTWSYIMVVSVLLENGGTWSVTRNPQPRVESLSIMVVGCVPAWVDVSVEPFHHGCRMCSCMGECKCRALSSWLQDVFLHAWM